MENLSSISGGTVLVSVKQLVNLPAYEWLTEASVRHLLFSAKPRINSKGETIPGNGLHEAGAIIRLGRRVLFDVSAFDQWLNSHKYLSDLEGEV